MVRSLVTLAVVLGGTAALAQPAAAQGGGEAGRSRIERWHPEAFEKPSQERTPALQLELDSGELDVSSAAPRPTPSLALQQAERRVRRSRIGIGASASVVAAGAFVSGAMVASSFCFDHPCPSDAAIRGGTTMGGVLIVGGLVGMIVSGISLRRHKKERTRVMTWGHAPPSQPR